MGRGDIMMTGRRRSGGRLLVYAIILVVLGCAVYQIFFRPGPTRTTGVGATAVSDAVQRAYNALPGSFRDKVPVLDFAAMCNCMASPDCGGVVPDVRQVTVTDSTGPEHPVARLRVEYPTTHIRAEYHFARIDGLWQLQSFSRILGELETDLKEPAPPGTAPRPAPPAKGNPTGKAPEGDAAQTPVVGARPATPCDYVVQPGDTLTAIARHFYGTTRYWRRILEANPGLTERNLRVGRKIRIPSNPEPAAPREEPDADVKTQ